MATIPEIMWISFKEIIASPFKDWSIWWYLAPVIVLWFVLEIYFGKYKQERLGWNTALGNGITLTWINIEAMRFLFSEKPSPFWLRFFLILLIMLYGLFVVYISFSHRFSSKSTYAFASPSAIYFLAAVTTLWGHGVLTLSFWVVVDLLLLFLALLLFFVVLRKMLPEAKRAEEAPLETGLEEKPFEAPELGAKASKKLKF
jgi:hypothetical protein